MLQNRWFLSLLCAALCAACEAREVVSGPATVIDGDTLNIGAAVVRLYGIDAPEGKQTCRRNETDWRCGVDATRKLQALVAGREVICEQRDTDTYGRVVAVCSAAGTDIGKDMVASGLALAYRHYSNDYVADEERARAARRGVWASEFTAPWDWRQSDVQVTDEARSRPPSPLANRQSCRGQIKGNINGKGEHIYHTRSSPWYDQTQIDESSGERWFCSEQEAREAGWRAPRAR